MTDEQFHRNVRFAVGMEKIRIAGALLAEVDLPHVEDHLRRSMSNTPLLEGSTDEIVSANHTLHDGLQMAVAAYRLRQAYITARDRQVKEENDGGE